jgi:hypothetical protein
MRRLRTIVGFSLSANNTHEDVSLREILAAAGRICWHDSLWIGASDVVIDSRKSAARFFECT